MRTSIHEAKVNADFAKTKLPKAPEIESELQQGVFNDVNEIGTSKKRKRKKKQITITHA